MTINKKKCTGKHFPEHGDTSKNRTNHCQRSIGTDINYLIKERIREGIQKVIQEAIIK